MISDIKKEFCVFPTRLRKDFPERKLIEKWKREKAKHLYDTISEIIDNPILLWEVLQIGECLKSFNYTPFEKELILPDKALWYRFCNFSSIRSKLEASGTYDCIVEKYKLGKFEDWNIKWLYNSEYVVNDFLISEILIIVFLLYTHVPVGLAGMYMHTYTHAILWSYFFSKYGSTECYAFTVKKNPRYRYMDFTVSYVSLFFPASHTLLERLKNYGN